MATIAESSGDVPQPDPAAFGAWLLEHKLTTVLVVDDLLDPPRWKDVPETNRGAFVDDVERNEELAAWLASEKLSPPTSVASAGSETYLEQLCTRRGERPDLESLWETHVDPAFAGADEVQELVSSLKALQGVKVVANGVRTRSALPAGVSVIFIDYILEPRDADAPINELKSIYKELGAAPHPVVVLMSGRGPLTPEQEERFRDETNTMPGMFYGLEKDQLRGADLYLVLGTIAGTLPNASALQAFRNAVAEASNSAAEEVATLVRNLTLEDHAFIQLLSLNSDGHPLGDYVLWLLSSYFARQLAENDVVRRTQEQVDRMAFKTPAMTHWGPSDAFVKAYQAAVFAPAHEDITASRYPEFTPAAAKESGDPATIVALHFGDVFVEEQSDTAFIVATPECDLSFGGSRPFPRDRSVILLPGKLKQIADVPFEKGTEDHARTELFEWRDSRWRIDWRLKEAMALPLRHFKTWAENDAAPRRRVIQARFPFAADIQRAYAADLTRVGVPVTPPLFQAFHATVYVATPELKHKRAFGVPEGAYVFTSTRYRKCVLADDLLRALRAEFGNAIEKAREMPNEEKMNALPDDGHRMKYRKGCEARAENNARQLQTLASDMSAFMDLRGPHELVQHGPTRVSSELTITDNLPTGKPETVLTVYLEAEESPSGPTTGPTEADDALRGSAPDSNPDGDGIFKRIFKRIERGKSES